MVNKWTLILLVCSIFLILATNAQATSPISKSTKRYLTCHRLITPESVADRKRNFHSITSPAEAIKKVTKAIEKAG